MSIRKRFVPNIPQVALVLGLIIFAFEFSNPYYISVMTFVGLYTMLAIGMCLMTGFAGQLSLAHPAFYGIGAYTSGILSAKYSVSPWVGLLSAMLISGCIAYSIGNLVLLKLRSYFLAVSTFLIVLIFQTVLTQWVDMTGGTSGLIGIPHLSIGSFPLSKDIHYYILTWVICLFFMFLSFNIIDSRIGRAIRSTQENEEAAESLGVDTGRYKVQIFVLGSVFASIGGSIYAHYVTFISPSIFSLELLLELLIILILGGIGNIWGAFVGSLVFLWLAEFLRAYMTSVIPTASGEIQFIIYSALVIILLIFMPEGLVGGMPRLYSGLRWGIREKMRGIMNRRAGV